MNNWNLLQFPLVSLPEITPKNSVTYKITSHCISASPSCTYHGSYTHNLCTHSAFPDSLYFSGQKLSHMTVAPLFQNNNHNKSLTQLPSSSSSIFDTENTALPFSFALLSLSPSHQPRSQDLCQIHSQNGRTRGIGEMWGFGGCQGVGGPSSLGLG